MHLTLVPAPGGTPARAAEAWLLPADLVGSVVERLSNRRGNPDDHRLHALPIGLFVIPGGDEAPEAWGPAILYGRLAENVFAPVDAVPNATVSADEWRELFPPGATYVWHPTAGLFRFAIDDGHRVTDLLRRPPIGVGDWERAVPGTALNARLRSLLPARSMTADAVWGGVSDEIGSACRSLDRLPPVPGEWRWPIPDGPWMVSLRRIATTLLAIGMVLAIGWLIVSLPGSRPPGHGDGGGADPTMPRFEIPWRLIADLLSTVMLVALVVGALHRLVAPGFEWWGGSGVSPANGRQRGTAASSGAPGGATEWLRGVLPWGAPPPWLLRWRQSLAKAYESRHDREIRRLIHLLNSDPEAGLRFAPPLFGEAGRGFSMPASRLAEQSIDDGVASLRPGGFVQVTVQQRVALSRRYRDLANREIGLGRHRRAAYIYARLLGDPSSAARVLLDGGHFREAAVLYEQTLGKPELAAAALERGGLFSEAIVLYERVGEHEKVADLSATLGHEDAAARAYRRAVEARLAANDRLDGARILATKMAEHDEALAVLAGGWPESPQAVPCATELLKRLGNLGRHAAAREHVCRMVDDGRGAEGRARAVLGILPSFARSYPDVETRRLIADQTRLLVADSISAWPTADPAPLMRALAALEPGDRLLERDTKRYAARRSSVVALPPPRRGIGACRVVPRGHVHLPAGVWTTLVADGASLHAAGYVRDSLRLVVARFDAAGSVQTATFDTRFAGSDLDLTGVDFPVLLAVSDHLGRAVIRPRFASAVSTRVTLPASGERRTLVVGSHSAIAGRNIAPFVTGMAYGGAAAFDMLRFRRDDPGGTVWIWERYDAVTEALLGTWQFPLSELQASSVRAVAFHGASAIVGHDEGILVMGLDGQTRSISSPEPVRRVAAVSNGDRLGIAASLGNGGMFTRGSIVSRFSTGFHAPHCCFLGESFLVVAGEGEIEVYAVDAGRLVLVASHEDRSLSPVAIAPMAGRLPGFAILAADGTTSTFEVQAGSPKKRA